MFSQKVAQQSLRRLAVQQPLGLRSSMMRASPVAVALGKNIQTRQVTSNSNTEDPNQILVKQRLVRPVAPHLSIYKPQIGWIGSSLHRISGVALSGALYIWATAYLASPFSIALKTTLALPFTYHSLNGLRHLMWDLGRGLSNPIIIKTGWTVIGLSIASAVGLALL
ncbi:hypothetical protein N7535_003083 [Penicillium sp. DV-2018c]|nr:hypothetical protein N7461_001224 [Penicillium sp. DV-2018c]KAJ5576157.1 hypothetical protein N7535_003083 [Penicillium sp. DV-2018c]